MAQQTINIGAAANDGTGDPIRSAFTKVNSNFTELYEHDANNTLPGQTGNSGKYLTTNGTSASWATLTIPNLSAVNQSIVPDTNEAYDLGSSTLKFRDLYLSGTTLYVGDATITTSGGAVLTVKAKSVGGGLLNGGENLSTLTLSSPPVSASSTYRIGWGYQNLDPAGPDDVGYTDYAPGSYTVVGTTLTLSGPSFGASISGAWTLDELYSDTAELSSADTVKTSTISPIGDSVTVSGGLVADTLTTSTSTATISSGNLTIDLSQPLIKVTLTENVTTITFTNPPAAGKTTSTLVVLTQDGTGSRTITGTGFLTASGLGLSISSAPNSVSMVSFLAYDATHIIGLSVGEDYL